MVEPLAAWVFLQIAQNGLGSKEWAGFKKELSEQTNEQTNKTVIFIFMNDFGVKRVSPAKFSQNPAHHKEKSAVLKRKPLYLNIVFFGNGLLAPES